jgi:hypothetical protein
MTRDTDPMTDTRVELSDYTISSDVLGYSFVYHARCRGEVSDLAEDIGPKTVAELLALVEKHDRGCQA